MKAMKRTVLPSALMAGLLLSASADMARAATVDYTFAVLGNNTTTAGFVMFDGYDPTFSLLVDALNNDGNLVDVSGDLAYIYTDANSNATNSLNPAYDGTAVNFAGDPMHGTMAMDWTTGAGTATILSDRLYFGSPWYARNVVLTEQAGSWFQDGLAAGSTVRATMLFDWGALDGGTSCGLTNCDIGVTVDWAIDSSLNFTTIYSDMPGGPFAGFQPTFSGTMVAAVPVPATAWIVGSGLIGLIGVGRARRKSQLAA